MEFKKTKWYHIDHQLISVKGFYFITFAAVGCLFPFIPLYMKAIGLSKLQAGIIFGTMPFALFVVQPAMGAIADRFQRHKLCVSVCCVFTALFFNLILLVPSSHTKFNAVNTSIICEKSGTHVNDCFTHKNESFQNQKCPLSFDQYYRNIQRSYSSTPSTREQNNSTTSTSVKPLLDEAIMECSFRCNKIEGSQLEPNELCFWDATDTTGSFMNKSCSNSIKYLSGQTFLYKFRLLLPINEGKLHNENSSETCNKFEISMTEYEGQQYRKLYCMHNMTLSCELLCSPMESCVTSVSDNLSTSSFWLFFFFLFLGKIGYAPILSLLDAIVYNVLGSEKRYKWGKQRLWGNVSLALFAVASAVIMDKLKDDHSNGYFQFAFYMYGIIFVVLACCLYFAGGSTEIYSGRVVHGARQMLNNGKIIVFLVIIFYFGFVAGGIEAFLYWFLEAGLKTKLKIIPGLCMFSNCVGEIIVFYFSGNIIKRIGHLSCLYIALIGFFIRLFSYSFLTNAWYVLPVELLNGVTFSLMWAAATSYGSLLAPPGLSGTMQGILNGLYSGFGKGIGSLVTGELYTEIGLRWTFRLYGIISVLLLIVYAVLNMVVFEQNIQRGTSDSIDKANLKCPQTDDMTEPHIQCSEESKLTSIKCDEVIL